MTMKEVAISEFKAKCLALLERGREDQAAFRVTRHGKPVAEVVPPTPVNNASWIGSMRDNPNPWRHRFTGK